MFEFDIKYKQPVPVIVRRGGGGAGHIFPWDKMEAGAGFTVPLAFWQKERGFTDAVDLKPTKIKDRIRRSFYGWRDAAVEDRSRYAILVKDEVDGAGAFTGTYVYLSTKDGAEEASNAAAAREPASKKKKIV